MGGVNSANCEETKFSQVQTHFLDTNSVVRQRIRERNAAEEETHGPAGALVRVGGVADWRERH